MVAGLLDQLQIFSQLYLIELLGLLTGLGLLELCHLKYRRLLTRFGMLVFFTNLSLIEFQVRYSLLILLYGLFLWMGLNCLKARATSGSTLKSPSGFEHAKPGLGLTLFLLFSVIDGFQWFWMESVHKNIQLTLNVPIPDKVKKLS